MATTPARQQHTTLARIARRVMLARGFLPDFAPRAVAELNAITGPATELATRDLRGRLWCSIDNDDSRDLDQLSVAEALPGGAIKVLIAIADVECAAPKGSASGRAPRVN